MNKYPRDAKIILIMEVIFIIVVIYVFQARLFERPSIQVDHFVAGAGGLGLCFIYPIVFLIDAYYLIKLSNTGLIQSRKGVIYIAPSVLPLVVTAFVHLGLERQAPDFKQKAYEYLIMAFDNGTSIMQDDVIEQLGWPLSKETFENREVWSYTYMPSTGFGWHKRIMVFDSAG